MNLAIAFVQRVQIQYWRKNKRAITLWRSRYSCGAVATVRAATTAAAIAVAAAAAVVGTSPRHTESVLSRWDTMDAGVVARFCVGFICHLHCLLLATWLRCCGYCSPPAGKWYTPCLRLPLRALSSYQAVNTGVINFVAVVVVVVVVVFYRCMLQRICSMVFNSTTIR